MAMAPMRMARRVRPAVRTCGGVTRVTRVIRVMDDVKAEFMERRGKVEGKELLRR
jgi:hypothetical protein